MGQLLLSCSKLFEIHRVHSVRWLAAGVDPSHPKTVLGITG
jgi:hypothetical protein